MAGHRVAEARGCRRGWRQWVDGVAEELAAIGHRERAKRLRACGRRALFAQCNSCGDLHAHALTSCGLRVCPFCARRDASERSERLARAMGLLARQYPRLRWRLITLTCKWDPADEKACTVAGLRARVLAIWKRWKPVWDALRRHCHAVAAEVALEISDRGHVHLHAAVLSRWIDVGWLARQWGDFVDVREIRGRSGAREVAKYTLKSHSPLDSSWLAGRHRRVIHWRLAARWEAATAGQQLRRAYGELRGLLSGELLTDELSEPMRTCTCGAPLPPVDAWRGIDTSTLARRSIRASVRIHWHFRLPGPP